MSDEVAKGTYKGEKADRFEVPSWNNAQADEICVQHKDAEDA